MSKDVALDADKSNSRDVKVKYFSFTDFLSNNIEIGLLLSLKKLFLHIKNFF